MIYTADTKKALKLCFEAHKNQTDKAGMPYVFHPFHVAEQMPDEKTTIVALLHDVVEDTSYSLQDIREMGFESDIVDALARLTHGKNVSYMDYVAKIKENSDLTRLDQINEEDLSRVEKYKAAIQLLSEG